MQRSALRPHALASFLPFVVPSIMVNLCCISLCMPVQIAKFLGARLLSEIGDANWQVRDVLTDWVATLDQSIREDPQPMHLNHLLDLRRHLNLVAVSFKAELNMLASLTQVCVVESVLRCSSTHTRSALLPVLVDVCAHAHTH